MARSKLNFRFHDPNPPGVTVEYIARVFVEANRKKVDRLIMEELSKKEQKGNEGVTENTGRYAV